MEERGAGAWMVMKCPGLLDAGLDCRSEALYSAVSLGRRECFLDTTRHSTRLY